MPGVKRDKAPELKAKETAWSEKARLLLRAEMTKHGVSMDELVRRLSPPNLSADDMAKEKANVANKIARGGFSSGFFVQCLDAVGTKTLLIGD